MSKTVYVKEKTLDMFCLDLLMEQKETDNIVYYLDDYKIFVTHKGSNHRVNSVVIKRKNQSKKLALFYVDFHQHICSSYYKTTDKYINSLDNMLCYYLEHFDWIEPQPFFNITDEVLAL